MRAASKLAVLTFFAVIFFLIFSGAAYADTGCSERDPLIKVFPSSITSPPGQTVAFTVEIKNQDAENCPIKPFFVNGTASRNLSVSFDPASFNLAPGEAKTSLMKVVIPSDAATRDYDIQIQANDVNFTSRQVAIVTVRQKIEDCDARVSNLRFKEKTATGFDNIFSRHDEVDVLVDLSLLGSVVTNVTVDLFVNGNLFDSIVGFYSGNSVTALEFSNTIRMENFVDNVNVRVTAVPFCNPQRKSEVSSTITRRQTDEKVDVSMVLGTPNDTVLGDQILSRVFLKNEGKKNTTVNVDAFLCNTNNECKTELECSDSIIFIETDDTIGVNCKTNATSSGTYRIKAVATFGEDRINKISKDFTVSSKKGQKPTAGTISEKEKINEITYRCSGKVRQAVYSTTEGVKVSDIEFCPNGCSGGICLQKTTVKKAPAPTKNVTTPSAQPKPVFSKPQYTPPIFDLNNFLDWLKNLLFTKPS